MAQVFGPRGAIYVVPQDDVAIFSKGLLPRDPDRLQEFAQTAHQVHEVLGGSPMRQQDVIKALPDIGGTRGLRWAATLGTIVPVWDTIDTIVHPVSPTPIDPECARLDLARRFFRYLGPATVADLQWFLDGSRADAVETVDRLGSELEPVSCGGITLLMMVSLANVIDTLDHQFDTVHLLPPDDVYINRRLRDILVPWPDRRRHLWPQAPPPGAMVVGREVAGTGRRRHATIEISPWQPIIKAIRDRVEATAQGLPLPSDGSVNINWREPIWSS